MAYRRRKNLLPSIVAVLESMGVRAWIHEGRAYHDGPDELRDEIGNAIERVRPTGVRRSALFFGAVLVTAMDRDSFNEYDMKQLDPLGQGNAGYILEKLKEIESD